MKTIRAKLFRNGGKGRRVVLEPVDEWSDAFRASLGTLSEDLPRPEQEPIAKLMDGRS